MGDRAARATALAQRKQPRSHPATVYDMRPHRVHPALEWDHFVCRPCRSPRRRTGTGGLGRPNPTHINGTISINGTIDVEFKPTEFL